MATLALFRADRSAPLPKPAFVGIALLFALVLPNPVGYVGGGGDDWYYVQAARCVAAHGWCVPDTHWAARWPLVAPMGLALRLFGDGVLQSMLVPLLYSLFAVLVFVRLVEDAWGRAVAVLAGVVFVATASFAKGLLQPNVETVELAWLLAAFWSGSYAVRNRNARAALVAGLLLGIAVQARMTSLAWVPILVVGLPLLSPDRRRLAIISLVGLAVPIGAEMALNGYLTGDPLLSQHLSAAHTRILSSELPASVDLSKSPLFNSEFIGGWAPAMGIHAHWTIQGVVNLLANPQMGPVLLAAILLLWLRRGTLQRQAPEVLLASGAVLYTGALIYALAIDPKARMFLPVAAIAAALVGRLTIDAWSAKERVLSVGLIASLVVVGAVETAKRFDMGKSAPLAGRWAGEHPGQVAVEDATRRFLTFDATVRALPISPSLAQPRLIVLVADECAKAAPVLAEPNKWVLVRSAFFGRANDPLNLCEFIRADRAAQPRL